MHFATLNVKYLTHSEWIKFKLCIFKLSCFLYSEWSKLIYIYIYYQNQVQLGGEQNPVFAVCLLREIVKKPSNHALPRCNAKKARAVSCTDFSCIWWTFPLFHPSTNLPKLQATSLLLHMIHTPGAWASATPALKQWPKPDSHDDRARVRGRLVSPITWTI